MTESAIQKAISKLLQVHKHATIRPKRVFLAVCIVIVVSLLYLEFRTTTRVHLSPYNLGGHSDIHDGLPETTGKTERVQNSTFLKLAPAYHRAILNPEDGTFPRLDCPVPTSGKYEYIRSNSTDSGFHRRYFFALDLHDSLAVLPRLLGSVIETIKFLGVSRCALSIVEGRSEDGTFEVLTSLSKELERIGIQYYFRSSDGNPEADNRIGALASLRNDALQPLLGNRQIYLENATVVFLNDVAICMEDILELIHQREKLGADMTCGMDWKNLWKDPTFYDVWIARSLNGDSFFEIGADGNWDSAWNLFWNHEESQKRFSGHQPFQVFACWNGGAVFTAKPFLEEKIRFRAPREGECFQGEPSIFCKEMWHLGYGKIAVIPTVNLEYSDEGAKLVKQLRGTPSSSQVENEDNLNWEGPPEKVKCIAQYDNQHWVPWDEYIE
ncbi:hypothetical protein HYFRA_00004568 [Hymenoscyphus fraxineus]|uniref:Glycosyltransferase family 69 protein n=1 Tax=Hymenoscyphus fraxineus TaxID=746836 RepID=A0A9N9KZ76_9HELO|nr:hypothetical protein HYFRA_00004568 [Hymenoscyphus fraxineus]